MLVAKETTCAGGREEASKEEEEEEEEETTGCRREGEEVEKEVEEEVDIGDCDSTSGASVAFFARCKTPERIRAVVDIGWHRWRPLRSMMEVASVTSRLSPPPHQRFVVEKAKEK